MADIFFNGQQINGVTHIGYDPASPDGDKTTITMLKPDGQLIFIDEAESLTPKQIRRLNRQIERSKYIGKRNTWISRLRYRLAKRRGRVQGEFFWKSNGHGEGIAAFMKRRGKK